MIYKYGTPEFKGLQTALCNFLEGKINDTNISNDKRRLSDILNKSIDVSNTAFLSELDKLNLKFNSWLNPSQAINENLLASQNTILLRILQGEDLEKFAFDTVIESLYLVLYADFYEASLVTSEINAKKFFDSTIDKLNYYIEYLSPEGLKRLRYLWFEIPKNVFTVHLNQHLDSKVLETVDKLQTNDTFIEERRIASESLKKDIKNIEKSLEKQKNEYNFVGLSSGFSKLREKKETELKTEKSTYRNLVIAIILIIFIKTIGSLIYLWSKTSISPVFIVVTVTTIFLLFILLYFFRISLLNIKSIKSQILQIDLRLTLCQFIHNYETDTAKLRNEDMKESFNKFESVIFAPLVATEEQMPATFDGLEQLTGILSSFNKGSK